jgi:hypothetical protein
LTPLAPFGTLVTQLRLFRSSTHSMRLSPLRTTIAALLASAVLLAAGWLWLRPAGPLLRAAEFGLDALSPNADGVRDVTRITYRLARPARVSISFLDESGRRFRFRSDNPRPSGEHQLLFSGIVAGFTLSDEEFEGQILARVLPDGDYTWIIEAAGGNEREELTGALTVAGVDSALPEMRGFSVSPPLFTPNRDGISDRVWVNMYLTKSAHVSVHLLDDAGNQRPIAERAGDIAPNEPGLHTFEYEGGVDLGVSPPPDGVYQVVALAEDAVGQKTRVEGQLTMEHGGVPRADIVNAQVEFSDTTVVQGERLEFTLTVENYGAAPIRTSGPAPGFGYAQDENANSFGWYEESGAWRVGIDCDTCIRDYPWRWALGTRDELTRIGEHWYLMPGQRATVSGDVTITQIPARNPLYFWAGLIHEDVEVSNINNRVEPHFITIVPKD